MINEGQTAFLRTTGEEVFVLAVGEDKRMLPTGSSLSGTVATVRRPVAGEHGCYHMMEQYLIEELETVEARMERAVTSQRAFEKRLQKAAQESGFETSGGSTSGDDGLPN